MGTGEIMEWLGDHATALMGLGGVATVMAALVAVFTLLRAGLDSASRSRPYVVAEFNVPEFAYKYLELTVRNTGPTAARDVRVEFDPPFDAGTDPSRLGGYVARRFARPLSVLGPGQRLTSVLTVDTEDYSKSDVGETLTVSLSYSSPWWRRPYRDQFILHRMVYAEQVFTESSDSVRGRLKSIAGSLEKLERHARTWEGSFDRVAEATAQHGLLTALPKNGVAWRVRQVSEDRDALENTGDTNAYDVSVEGNDRVRHLQVKGDVSIVRPAEHLKLLAMLSGGAPSPTVTVEWSEAAGGTRRQWIGTLSF